jgi:hypothetical protein
MFTVHVYGSNTRSCSPGDLVLIQGVTKYKILITLILRYFKSLLIIILFFCFLKIIIYFRYCVLSFGMIKELSRKQCPYILKAIELQKRRKNIMIYKYKYYLFRLRVNLMNKKKNFFKRNNSVKFMKCWLLQ